MSQTFLRDGKMVEVRVAPADGTSTWRQSRGSHRPRSTPFVDDADLENRKSFDIKRRQNREALTQQ